MRRLLFLIVIATGLYGGYWAVGRASLLAALDALRADSATSSVQIEWQGQRLRGFPSRFDTSLDAVTLRLPQAEIALPLFQIFMLSYRPNRAIAFTPGPVRATSALGTTWLTPGDLRASAAAGLSPDLPLDHLTVEGHDLALSHGGAGTPAEAALPLAQAETLLLALRPAGPPALRYQAHGALESIALSPDLHQRIDPLGRFPATMDRLSLDAAMILDRPLDRHSSTRPPRPTRLDLEGLRLIWGTSEAHLSGTLAIGPDRRANGTLRLRATGWRALLRLSSDMGAQPEGVITTYETFLAQLVPDSAGADSPLDIDLAVRDSVIRLGPLRLGVLPPL